MPNYRHVALVLGALLVGFTIGPSRAQSTSAAGAATADKSRRPMTLVDLLNIPRVLDPQMNSDGERIAFTLRTADWPNNRRVDQIWQIRADGSALTRLTSIASGVGAAKAWSPDGRTLAFLARGTSPGFSIFLLSEGGAPRQLSRHATSIIASQPGMLAWAPDGSAIYFLAADPPGAADVERDKLRGDIYSYDDYRQQHLWKITVADGQEQRLTSGDYSIVGFKVSPTGLLLVNRAPSPLVLDSYLSEVWTLHADGSASVQLTHNRFAESDAALSPDGSQILFVARANDRQEPYYNANLFLMPAAGGTPHALVPTFPYEVLRAEWAADGKSIWAVVNMGVHSELFQFDAATHTPRQITDGRHSIPEFVTNGNHRVFTTDDPTQFGDLWLLDAKTGMPRRVTKVYEYLDRDFQLPREESLQWKGADGATIEGILFYPLDYTPGTRYPLAVVLHGGPEDSDKFSFGPVVWQGYQQVLAAKGYAVLKPNYRGSAGYGNAFYREPVGGYFKQSHLDVLAGVDKVIAMGVADPDKLAVMGYSAGGHLTNKLITFTNRFKAAAVGAGASDWISMYGQTDTRADRDIWFGGSLWQKDAPILTYWEHSPIKDAWKVRTPTLFIEGERDTRVPLPQAVEMFRALKAQGVPTRLDVVPLDAHTWVRPQHQLYKMNAELEWFARYALKQPYSFEAAPAANDAGVIPPSQ